MTAQPMLRLDSAGTTIPAQQSAGDIVLTPIQGPPTTDGCSADTEPRWHNPASDSFGNRGKNTTPKIDGKGFRRGSRPFRRLAA